MNNGKVKAGDTVLFSRPHPSMAAWLKKLAGQTGTVCAPCEPTASKVRVRFDDVGGIWWIDPVRLDLVEG